MMIFFTLFLLTFEPSHAEYASSGYGASPDAIAVRVVPNPNHYSIARWYESQGFQGSPQALLVDGYEAIRDGRTVYVNAANINQQTKAIYTNIYLISYNQDQAPNTVDILGQIISHWKFNSNLTEGFSPSCSVSSLSCTTDTDCPKESACATVDVASSSCLLKTSVNCLVDTDCPTNFFCDSLKSRVARDLKRVGRLEEVREALFNFKKTNNRYPPLVSGTYLSGHSLSVWPSWSQTLLSGLALPQSFIDPVNRLGLCPGYDSKTCWDAGGNRFFNNQSASSSYLTLPLGSYVLGYSTDTNGSKYNLCAVLESRYPSGNPYMSSGFHFSPNDPTDSACALAGVAAGGNASNTPPQLIGTSLVGETNQEFNGYIKVLDKENNPLTWSLTAAYNTSGWPGWSGAPVLKDTSNPNQKKVYALKAGNPGTYNMSVTVSDGQGGVLDAPMPIKILSSAVSVEADDVEYLVDPINLFGYSFSFGGAGISPSSYTVTQIGGPFDILHSAGMAKTVTTVGANRYKVGYSGLIALERKFYRDTDFKYKVTVSGFTKNFKIKVKPENPQLEFNCATAGRINIDYSCTLGSLQQGNHSITYWATSALPADLLLVASSTDQLLQGKSNATTTSYIHIKAINEYGASSTKMFALKFNTYCGDGIKAYNTEGRGGAYNDGYEDCDGTSAVATTVASSTIDSQYGCSTTSSSPRPYPIVTSDQCIFLSPVKGGGYCGDGYCQTEINGSEMEKCGNCASDCCQAQASCVPNCNNKSCGNDGCGGSCGDCISGQICNGNGNCVSSQCGSDTACNDYNYCTNDSCSGANTPASQCVNAYNNLSTLCTSGMNYPETASSTPAGLNGLCIYQNSSPCASGECNIQGSKTCTQGAYGACLASDPRHNYCTGKCEGETFYCNGGDPQTNCSHDPSYLNSSYPCNGTCIDTGNQQVCAFKAEVKTCSAALGMPASSFFGDAPCNGNCSGYDTSQCVANVCNPNTTACQNQCNDDFTNCIDPDCALDQYWCQNGCGSNQQCLEGCAATYTQCINSLTCSDILSNCLQQCNPNSCYWYQVPVSEDSHVTVGTTCMVKMNVNGNGTMICSDAAAHGGAQWFQGTIASSSVKICSVTGCTEPRNPNKCRYYNGNWSNNCYVHKTW